ncbi:hypothetical protein JOD43_000599 [Pullulanibacillus pueri]|uniref:Uncharacterized protein n=1 Tax=Pullulanibacillus pueri TaxID=1437324 RepID=A0A8J2ZSF3_9BACL|nr:hypothetical protein [Pullulanibacillus pueri]MBM7680440.1 hypothetical protein [Pullulanibacillus pueri]GGH75080.1 hypothetical protein GCM10007096_03930 [Pullulanibacillus pueri]
MPLVKTVLRRILMAFLVLAALNVTIESISGLHPIEMLKTIFFVL